MKIQHLETGQTILEARAGINVQRPGPAFWPVKLGPLQFTAFGTYNLIIEIDGQREPVIVDFNVQLMSLPGAVQR